MEKESGNDREDDTEVEYGKKQDMGRSTLHARVRGYPPCTMTTDENPVEESSNGCDGQGTRARTRSAAAWRPNSLTSKKRKPKETKKKRRRMTLLTMTMTRLVAATSASIAALKA
ncbi:hypothetical protein HZH66_013790 [Vespula vulgaris]|uniref:Uncharacterized protein n=1 Tax=Vespula vulgaris TaxID=7454 RepID=A0A834J3L7_VESVU|nr:hypothetical protein HZH66_013790 [Vespula vulgaris]